VRTLRHGMRWCSMKERPILMSAPMVRAILAGTKTQTRRVVKGQALEWLRPGGFTPEFTADPANGLCPYGQPGGMLWVKEAWRTDRFYNELAPSQLPKASGIRFEASKDSWSAVDHERVGKLRSSIHMPRWASRITLEVTGVRLERLQDISEADAIAEGIEKVGEDWKNYGDPMAPCILPRTSYVTLWASIHGFGSWDANPFVWVVEFRRIDA
jgi:hypothetical protein